MWRNTVTMNSILKKKLKTKLSTSSIVKNKIDKNNLKIKQKNKIKKNSEPAQYEKNKINKN